MPLDITLERADLLKTVTLKATEVTMQGLTPQQNVLPLPQRETLTIDLGNRTRTFTIIGKFTYGTGGNAKTAREDLEEVWLRWWEPAFGDGTLRFQWGTKNDGTPYDFKCVVKSLVVKWSSLRPGTSDKPYYEFTLVLQETGSIGALN